MIVNGNGHTSRRTAFTLLELLVVIAVLAVLAATLLPAMAGTKARGQITTCVDNQRQLALAWRMFSDDNSGSIVGPGDSNLGTWRVRPDFFPGASIPFPPAGPTIRDTVRKYDEAGYRAGALYRYAKDASIIHCPADPRINATNIPAYVSYSGLDSTGSATSNPGARFLWIEESDPRTITANGWQIGENLGSWAFQQSSGPTWWDTPAVFHITSTVFSYADGHVAIRRWQDNATVALAAYAGGTISKASVALQVSDSSSPTDPPLNTDGLGSPHDLPFMRSGYGQ